MALSGLAVAVLLCACVASARFSEGLRADMVSLVALASDAERTAGGYLGRHRLVAARDLDAGAIIGVLPRSLLLRARNATTTAPFLDNRRLSEVQLIMFALLNRKQDNNFDWLLHETEGLTPPLLWTRDDVMELRETQLWSNLRDTLSVLKEKHSTLVKALLAEHGDRLDKADLSFARWKRAYCLVRALQVADADADGEITLVPWIALFSYGSTGNAHLHLRNDSVFELVMSAAVRRGGTVTLNDDAVDGGPPFDNQRLLDVYGLLLGKRSFSFSVSVSLDRVDPMYGNKRELFERRFRDSSPLQYFALDGKTVPSDLLFALRIYNAETIDVHDLPNALLDKPISARNERTAWETLGSLCAQKLANYPTTLEEDKELLRVRREQLTRNAKNAILFRRAEKRILKQTLALVERETRKLDDKWMMRDADPLRLKSDNIFETVPEGEEL